MWSLCTILRLTFQDKIELVVEQIFKQKIRYLPKS